MIEEKKEKIEADVQPPMKKYKVTFEPLPPIYIEQVNEENAVFLARIMIRNLVVTKKVEIVTATEFDLGTGRHQITIDNEFNF